jgi:cytochrome c-type biogenesis protein CcmE
MALLPRSPRARRRLTFLAVAAPVLALAVGLTLWAMREQVTYFYSPVQLAEANVDPGVTIRLGGLVEPGSVERSGQEETRFVITDGSAVTSVVYRGDLPDLFREGQGVVVQGALTTGGDFRASQVLAKHDETYMPREVADALKREGRWQEGQPGA